MDLHLCFFLKLEYCDPFLLYQAIVMNTIKIKHKFHIAFSLYVVVFPEVVEEVWLVVHWYSTRISIFITMATTLIIVTELIIPFDINITYLHFFSCLCLWLFFLLVICNRLFLLLSVYPNEVTNTYSYFYYHDFKLTLFFSYQKVEWVVHHLKLSL